MKKRFNITGTCIAETDYMVDTTEKLKAIMELIEYGEYFTINRPRQYGKTTTLNNIENKLKDSSEYLLISISFEGIGDAIFQNEREFSKGFISLLTREKKVKEYKEYLNKQVESVEKLEDLSELITEFTEKIEKKVVLLIDEVDKSSNNQLFLSFLGMLRDKYLRYKAGKDATFYSVILAGVYDVKNLKLKLRPGEEAKYNSPWNIASDFKVDMTFNPKEIETMLEDYISGTGAKLDKPAIAERIYFYTSGYPFLVSKLCKVIEEDLQRTDWILGDVDDAVKQLLKESNTNFDSLIQNYENYPELAELVKKVILGNEPIPFLISRPMINLGVVLGLFSERNGKLAIHNKIFEEYLTQHIVVGMLEKGNDNGVGRNAINAGFIKPDGRLDLKKAMLKFQEVIKEKYSKSELLKSDEFLENDLRMLFLVFMKPIINGIGFSFKEVQTSEEKRMDVVILFRDEKFVVELKIWRGIEYHKQGIGQLKGYMLREGINKGYMLIMDKHKNKQFIVEEEEELMMVYI